jgi:hypothetical protein
MLQRRMLCRWFESFAMIAICSLSAKQEHAMNAHDRPIPWMLYGAELIDTALPVGWGLATGN